MRLISYMRSIAAVVYGYLCFGISAAVLFRVSNVDPGAEPSMAFRFGSTMYGAIFATLGGYIAALVARRSPVAHALAVALLLTAIAGLSMAVAPGSKWSRIAAICFMAPGAVLGGWLRKRLEKKQAAEAAKVTGAAKIIG